MWKELGPGLRLTLVMTVLTGLVYPGLITGICQLILPAQANGSLVTVNGKAVGSSLIAQAFTKPEYFHPRPSSAGSGYDASLSGGSNLGPTSAKLIKGISVRIVHYCLDNGIAYESSVPLDKFKNDKGDIDDVKLVNAFNDAKKPLVFTPKSPIPADAVTASGSGLDPHISLANAEVQAARVAQGRGVSPQEVHQLIASKREAADLGFLGEPRVNVLMLNVALDASISKK
jgi:K+-transporting ATPase ATPase C chain